MKSWRFQVADGRRMSGYQVQADTEEQAKEYFIKYLSLLGVLVCQEITPSEEEVENG